MEVGVVVAGVAWWWSSVAGEGEAMLSFFFLGVVMAGDMVDEEEE